MWILRLRVPEDVQAIQQQLVAAQEIKRMVAKGGGREIKDYVLPALADM
jgi:hypothetical protein